MSGTAPERVLSMEEMKRLNEMGYVVTQGQNLSPEDPKSKGEEGSEGGVLSMEKLEVTKGQDLFPQDEESLTKDLSGTNMHTLPQYIFGLVALQKLLLRNCEILMMELPPEIGDLKNLVVPDLEGTEILCLPMEIAKLVNLMCLKVSFYGYANQTVIPKTVLSNLLRLKELIIDVTPYGEWWDVEVKDIIDDLRNLKELTSLKLSLPTAELLEDLTLILPGLANFRFTVGRHEEHFISRLPRNVEEEFNNREKLEKGLKFINGNCIPNEITKVLKHANAFFLQCHWTAESLSEFGHENLNEVKFFLVMECNEFRTIIDSEKLYQGKDERAESEDFPDFDEAMVLGSLQRLIIRYMKHMESIWKGPVAKGSLSNLKSLALHTCPMLTTLFTIDMLSYLINLEELIVEDCPKINSLVSHQNSGSKSVLFLPSLKKISLLHLPGLVSISSGQEIAPKLERIVVFYCPKLKLSATEVSSKELKVIKGDKEWWDALKWYESDLSTEDEDYLDFLFIPLRKDGDLMAQLTEDEIAGYGQGEVGSDCLSNFSEEELLEEISSKELEEIPSEELEKTPSNPRELEDESDESYQDVASSAGDMGHTDSSWPSSWKLIAESPYFKDSGRSEAQLKVQHQSHVSGPNELETAVGGGGGSVNQFETTSLYVGDLDFNVTDSQLYDLFNQAGQVVSVRVCRDMSTRCSLGYGYVNYNNPQDAARAMDLLNFTTLNGKTIWVMYSHRDPSICKSGAATIFIKNLDKAVDTTALHDTFSTFGNILSCNIATDPSGQSKGYGFVQFENDESGQNAIDKLNGMLLNDRQVYVGHFLRKQERETVMSKTKFNNLHVENLAESTTEEDLEKIFGEYGQINSVAVMREGNEMSKCIGFVNFENAAAAAANAVEALNGKKVDEKEWYVGKAQKKSERELELKSRFEP